MFSDQSFCPTMTVLKGEGAALGSSLRPRSQIPAHFGHLSIVCRPVDFSDFAWSTVLLMWSACNWMFFCPRGPTELQGNLGAGSVILLFAQLFCTMTWEEALDWSRMFVYLGIKARNLGS